MRQTSPGAPPRESDDVVAKVQRPDAIVEGAGIRFAGHGRNLTWIRPHARVRGGLRLASSVDAINRTPDSLRGKDAMHVRELIDRVRGEFNEMPGLQLTVPQAARLLGIEPADCRDVIDLLVDAAFLRWTSDGTIVRAAR